VARGRHALPQSLIEFIFYGSKLALLGLFSLYQKYSVGLKYATNALAAGHALDPPGELTTLPQTA